MLCPPRLAQVPLTQRVSIHDAVFHLPIGARVLVVGQEGPHAGPRLALGDIKWSLIVSGEGGHVVIDVIHVHEHLRWWTGFTGAPRWLAWS